MCGGVTGNSWESEAGDGGSGVGCEGVWATVRKKGWAHQRSLWPCGVLSSVLERVRDHGEPDAWRGEVEVWAVQPHHLGERREWCGGQRIKNATHTTVNATEEIRCMGPPTQLRALVLRTSVAWPDLIVPGPELPPPWVRPSPAGSDAGRFRVFFGWICVFSRRTPGAQGGILTLNASASTFATSPTGVAGDAGVPGGGAGGVAPGWTPGAMPGGGRGAGGVAAGALGVCAIAGSETRNLVTCASWGERRKEEEGEELAALP